ncbi:MAG: DedA family protein [Methylococcales bacterium]|nr:DedA family protein [Methylococcales bacterium]
MQHLTELLNIFLHLDHYLSDIIQNYGTVTYALLFLIVFCETGLVVLPFLPGDSLLFAAGTFAAKGDLGFGILFASLAMAAVVGDALNYEIGRRLGPKIANHEKLKFINQAHLDKTQHFYDKYGAKTIIIARFVPVVRTFAPFVAGIGSMTYQRFLQFNAVGALAWVAICLAGGYLFGNLPVVKNNFSVVILGIVIVSILPAVIEIVRHKYLKSN